MADYQPVHCPRCLRPYQLKRNGTIRAHWKGQRPPLGGPITSPCAGSNQPPGGEWTVTNENVYRLWDEDIIVAPCKPHFSEPGVIDGLTIKPHNGMDQQIARFGDTICLDRDGRYTVHPAAEDTPR